MVWIVKDAKEEHRAAIEWLNNNTNSEINFFLIEIHAYKIGDSEPAPMFEVVEKPNDFVKHSKAPITDKELNKSQSERLLFWEQFNQIVINRGKPFNLRKATTDHWYDIALGTSDAHVAIDLVSRNNYIVVEVYINDKKELFDRLLSYRETIEKELDFEMEWDRLDNKKASRIKYRIPGLDFDDHSNYDELMNRIIDVAVKVRDVFSPYVR